MCRQAADQWRSQRSAAGIAVALIREADPGPRDTKAKCLAWGGDRAEERGVDSEIADSETAHREIQVYCTSWCGLTFRVREYLMKARLTHEFFDIERDPKAREFVLAVTDGRFPIVVIEHHVITDPTIAELQRMIDAHAIRPSQRRSRTGASLESLRYQRIGKMSED